MNDYLLNAAVLTIGILEAQTHLGFVFFKIHKLFGVKSPTPFPKKKNDDSHHKNDQKHHFPQKNKRTRLYDSLTNILDSIFVHHPAFD